MSAQDAAASDSAGTAAGSMGRIVAVLVDATTGAPISEAFVSLPQLSRRTLSDSAGTLFFLDVPPGRYELEIRHIAYGEQTTSVDVAGMTSAIVGIELDPRAISLAPIDVVVEQRPRYLEEQGFYDRRAVGMGAFFDPQFVERWGVGGWGNRADRFIDLLLDMSPQLSSSTGTPASSGNGGYISSIGDGFGGQCPAVYIDGEPAWNDSGKLGGRPSTELEMMSTYMIGAVEVYPSSHGVPGFALEPEAGCGSIVIWTNRWRDRVRELGGGDVELCRPENPGFTQVEGEIRDEHTDVLLPGAHVSATIHPNGRPEAAETSRVVADRNGRYRICDIPPDHTLSIRVTAAKRESPERIIALEGGIVRHDLDVPVAGPGDLVGRIVDRDTGRPVAAADILVVGTDSRTQTDEEGYFALEDVRPGDQFVEIRHLGFEPVTEMVSVVADRTVDLQVQMSADPIALEPIVITALRDRRLEIRGFYDRQIWGRRTGLGHFFDEADLELRSAGSTTSLLRDVPGVDVSCSGRSCTVRPSRGSCERMNVYLNGTLAIGEGRRSSLPLDEFVRPGEIAGMEVYPSAGSIPAEFSGTTGQCGAVVIWTR